jgi:hypothetical protein
MDRVHEDAPSFLASPNPMRDIADDCLAAFVHCDVFHPDGLLTSGSVSLERRDLRREGTGRAY